MDPLSALGLAAAVVQFASLSAKIIKALMSAGDSASGLPSDCADLDDIYSKLSVQSQRLETAHRNASRSIEREALEPHHSSSQAPQWDEQFLDTSLSTLHCSSREVLRGFGMIPTRLEL